MRLSRKLGLYGSKITPKDIFATITSYSTIGRSNSSLASLTKSKPTWASVGDIYYSFFAVRDSLEISRIVQVDANNIQKTDLCSLYYQVADQYTSSVSGTSLVSDQTIRGGAFLQLKFSNKYPASVIDEVLSQMSKRILKGVLRTGSSTLPSETDSHIMVDYIDNYSGLIFAIFRDSSTVTWSLSDSGNPLVPIPSSGSGAAGTASTWLSDRSALHLVDHDDFYAPYNGSETPGVASFTCMMFGSDPDGTNNNGQIPYIYQ